MIALALVLRLVIFGTALWGAPDGTLFLSEPDSREYIALGRNMFAGHGFSSDTGATHTPDFRRTPIYPLLLASAFLLAPQFLPGVIISVIVNVLLSVFTVAITSAIALRLAGTRAALVAGLVLALDLTSAVYANLLLTEVTFTALLTAAIVLIVHPAAAGKWRRAVAAGVLLGAAALCRPIGLFLGPAVTPAIVIRDARLGWSRAARTGAALNLAFFLILSVWILRNFATFGVASLSPMGAVNLYFHRAAYIQARVDHVSVDDVRNRWERDFEDRSASWSEPARMAWLGAEGRRIITAHPATYLQLYGEGLWRMFGPERNHILPRLGIAGDTIWSPLILATSLLQLGIVYVLALVGSVKGLVHPVRRTMTFMLLCLIAYFVLMAGPEAYARFRVPLMPLLAVLAGMAVSIGSRAGLRAGRSPAER